MAEWSADGKVWKEYEVWYPSDMKGSCGTYLLVIMANGTGIKASQYREVSRHLSALVTKQKFQCDMLRSADGYMTAWFMYRLKDDTEVGKVFFGENAEILSNENLQDVKVDGQGQ